MTGSKFLSCVEPSTKSLFAAIQQADIAVEYEKKFRLPIIQYRDYEFGRWAESGADEIDEHLARANQNALDAHGALLNIETASAAIAGAILQIAKQSISMVWPGRECPKKGRLIKSQHISEVIWHCRNQAQHFEEGQLKKQSNESVKRLASDFDLDFDSLVIFPRSLARDALNILGWHSYEPFAKDMVELLTAS